MNFVTALVYEQGIVVLPAPDFDHPQGGRLSPILIDADIAELVLGQGLPGFCIAKVFESLLPLVCHRFERS